MASPLLLIKKYWNIIFVIIIAIILGIVITILLTSKSSGTSAPIPIITYPNATLSPDTIGFCGAQTYNGVIQPPHFRLLTNNEVLLNIADTAGLANDIQYKWAYDDSNLLNIVRTITNANNVYTSAELTALGQTNTKGNYLVNIIRTIYDKNDPKFKQGTQNLNPYILTKYSQCV
jgi:hypothetical protein